MSWLWRMRMLAVGALSRLQSGNFRPFRTTNPRRCLLFEELEPRIVPSLLGQQLFPSDNAWNQNIANAPIASNSATIISEIISNNGGTAPSIHPDWGEDNGAVNGNDPLYGIPINIVHGNSVAKVSVSIGVYASESDVVSVPMPANPVIEGDYQNGPNLNGPGYDNSNERGDSHLIVWDEDNNIAYEFYLASRPSDVTNNSGGWEAAQESVWNMNTDTFRTLGETSADAAGLSILAGLVRPDEGLPTTSGGQGVIDHAIRMTLPQSDILDQQYVYPASHEIDASTNGLPMGSRLRLENNQTVDALIAKMSPEAQIVATAMQQYGLILADAGSAMYITGTSATPGANNNIDQVWNMDDVLGLESLDASDFQVVSLTPIVTNLSSNSGPAGETVTINGQNFSGAAGHLSVFFGSTASTSVTYVSDNQIKALVPSGSGTVNVTVQSGVNATDNISDNPNANVNAPIFGYGTSAVVATDKFTYSSIGITTEPSNDTVNSGSSASFTAAATATPSPTVQWEFSTDGGSTWSNVIASSIYSNVTTDTLSISDATASMNGYQYQAVFSNVVSGTTNTATTSAATLTVDFAPSVTSSPNSQTVNAGSSMTFSATASGGPTPTVQWQISTDGTNWSNLGNTGVYSGVTNGTLTITGATAALNGDQYRAVFSNTQVGATSPSTATSNPATLTVDFAPSVTTSPSNQTTNAGSNATFTAAASGNPSPTVKWQISTNGGSTWSNLSGTGATLTITSATASMNGNRYRAVFSNTLSGASSSSTSTSSAATLTVDYAPSITSNPSSGTVETGNNFSFSASASGNPTPTAQWQISTNGGSTWSNLSNGGVYGGVASTTLTISGATMSLNGDQYRAVFSNTLSGATSPTSATTTAAKLSVTLYQSQYATLAYDYAYGAYIYAYDAYATGGASYSTFLWAYYAEYYASLASIYASNYQAAAAENAAYYAYYYGYYAYNYAYQDYANSGSVYSYYAYYDGYFAYIYSYYTYLGY